MDATRIWSKVEPVGMELADIRLDLVATTLVVWGAAIGSGPHPYRVEYALHTASDYVTERLVVHTRGKGFNRTLELTRAASGTWSCTTEATGALDLPPPGGDLSDLGAALDCDLALSPLTNSMPVLRHQLHRGSGGPIDLDMAWVALPDLSVTRSSQRYAAGGSVGLVHFETRDTPFSTEIEFDSEGLVVEYPHLATLVR